MKKTLIALVLLAQSAMAQTTKTEQMQQRAREIIAQMTVKEKIDQLMNHTPGIERLGIKPYDLATVQADGKTALVKGTYTIRVGASAPGKRADELGVSHADATIIVK